MSCKCKRRGNGRESRDQWQCEERCPEGPGGGALRRPCGQHGGRAQGHTWRPCGQVWAVPIYKLKKRCWQV